MWNVVATTIKPSIICYLVQARNVGQLLGGAPAYILLVSSTFIDNEDQLRNHWAEWINVFWKSPLTEFNNNNNKVTILSYWSRLLFSWRETIWFWLFPIFAVRLKTVLMLTLEIILDKCPPHLLLTYQLRHYTV